MAALVVVAAATAPKLKPALGAEEEGAEEPPKLNPDGAAAAVGVAEGAPKGGTDALGAVEARAWPKPNALLGARAAGAAA